MTQVLHVIDFEGTRSSGILEYGVVTLCDMEITDTSSVLCKGEFNQYIDLFIELRKQGSFVGHNASVEDRLLRHHVASPGFVKETSKSDKFVNTWAPWIDTKVLYKNFFREIMNFSLKNLIEKFNLSSQLFILANKFCELSKTGYHNALFDALATSILLQHLISELKFRNIYISLETLIEYSKKSGLI